MQRKPQLPKASLPQGLKALFILGFTFVSVTAAVTRTSAQAAPTREDLQKSLRTSCELRMRELESREQKSLAAVQWQQDGAGARGAYIGYNPDYVCTLSPGDNSTPIGRMQYREIHFEKRGTSIEGAMRAEPEAVRFEDVTQVLSYRRGAWE